MDIYIDIVTGTWGDAKDLVIMPHVTDTELASFDAMNDNTIANFGKTAVKIKEAISLDTDRIWDDNCSVCGKPRAICKSEHGIKEFDEAEASEIIARGDDCPYCDAPWVNHEMKHADDCPWIKS